LSDARAEGAALALALSSPASMPPLRASVRCVAGALLVLATGSAARATAPVDREGATSAAPVACTAEQFALRSYVNALGTGDVTSGARDPARIARAITPSCRQAIDSGRWPGLATELLAHVSGEDAMRRAICAMATSAWYQSALSAADLMPSSPTWSRPSPSTRIPARVPPR